MKLYKVFLLMTFFTLIKAKMRVTILNVYQNKTSPKYVEIIKLEISPRALMFVEADLLKDLDSIYVR